jgi:hypothetical protein
LCVLSISFSSTVAIPSKEQERKERAGMKVRKRIEPEKE